MAIRITPDLMRTRAGQYRGESQSIGSVISNMDGLLASLQEEWEGEASKSYADRYSELKPTFQKAQQLVDEIATSLDKVAQQMEDTDSSIAAAFRG
jgi:WXG100 family type VII secretion target